MSILDLLARFRPSKASAEPVSRTDDPGAAVDALLSRMTERGLFDQPKPTQPQHPLAPEREPPPLDWAAWTTMQQQTFRRGWSFARYAVKSPPPESRMACVFGIVRGAFGICAMDFYVCGLGGFQTLHAISHLPSGMGCGLFDNQESAAVACDIASRITDDWETLDPYADSAATTAAIRHMQIAWTAAGLAKADLHAHVTSDTSTAPLPIWFQDYSTIIMGRPEKLS